MERLAGKHALITGGAQGIGEAIARRFVAAGARVVISDIQTEKGTAVANSLGGAARFARLDVTSEESWRALAAELEANPVNILVNNAGGLLSTRTLDEIDLEEWNRTIAFNLTSVFLAMHFCLPLMLKGGGGSIINIGSCSGVRGQADAPAYQAAKGGLRLLTSNAALTYAGRGIRINIINPGIIATPLVANDAGERTQAFIRRTPLSRMGEPDDIAAAAVFLASDESGFVTGAEFNIDGGYTL
jgi:3alpha(or 20beta)-hydroxysteroid dehydrogenase